MRNIVYRTNYITKEDIQNDSQIYPLFNRIKKLFVTMFTLSQTILWFIAFNVFHCLLSKDVHKIQI